jgi:predicted nucleotide-binding protein
MIQLPCFIQVALWLSHQRKRVNREAVRRQFRLNEADLNALLHYLKHRELIKDVACLGETEIVQSFVVDPSTRRLVAKNKYCEGWGEKPAPPLPRDRVFIVHGRNVKALKGIEEFLRSLHLESLTFRDAIKLAKQNAHIDEIVEIGMTNAHATLVLFTGDEDARLKKSYFLDSDPISEKNLQSQPRPNVIFEAGMALARNPATTIFVQFGPHLRPFSDIAGLFVLLITDAEQDRRILKEQLVKIGCKVNEKDGKWKKAGKFPPPPKQSIGKVR